MIMTSLGKTISFDDLAQRAAVMARPRRFQQRKLWQFVVVINLSFWLCSVVALGFSLWLRLDKTYEAQLEAWGGGNSLYPSVTVMLVGSAVMCFTGTIGLLASCYGAKHLLILYFGVLVTLVVGGHLGAGLWALFTSRRTKTDIQIGLSVRILNVYGRDGEAELKAHMDTVQQRYSCCGVSGPDDWSRSYWAHTFRSMARRYTVPESCCQQNRCDFSEGSQADWMSNGRVFREGCAGYLNEIISARLLISLLLGSVIAAVEVLALVVTTLLIFCVLPRKTRLLKKYRKQRIRLPPDLETENGDIFYHDVMDSSIHSSPEKLTSFASETPVRVSVRSDRACDPMRIIAEPLKSRDQSELNKFNDIEKVGESVRLSETVRLEVS